MALAFTCRNSYGLLLLVLLIFSPRGCLGAGGDINGTEEVKEEEEWSVDPLIEFSEVIFDNVTELDIFDKLVADYTETDPVSGLSGTLAYLWYIPALVSRDCVVDSWNLVTDIMQYKDYAMRMRASNANPPRLSTIHYTENTRYLANFELCTAVKRTEEIPMTAQVCDMTAPPFYINVGTCVPASCSNKDLNVIANAVLEQYDTIYSGVYFLCVYKAPWTWDSIFVMFILWCFAMAVITGTVYDLVCHRREKKRKDKKVDNVPSPSQDTNVDQNAESAQKGVESAPPEVATETTAVVMTNPNYQGVTVERPQATGLFGSRKLQKMVLSFSVVLNGAGVLSAKKTAGNLGALNGMRVLSMWWIVWYHCAYFLFFTRLDNPTYTRDVGAKTWFKITWEGPFAVDTFFVLSALLVTYLTLKQLDKGNGKINWLLFYVHRYIRLTPVYMVCLGIWTSLTLPIGEGTSKNEFFGGGRSLCRAYWWTNLFYINNLLPYPGSVNLCMGWTWYLANDMQFFIFTPIFIVLLYKPSTRKYGLIALASVTALSCIITAAVSGYWGYTVGNYREPYNNRSDAFPPDADRNYAKPWCRIQAYTVGIFVGYLLYRFKGKQIKIHLAWTLLGWALAIGTIATVIFAMAGTSYTEPLPQWFAATWLGVRRFLFAAAVGWIAFACVTGNGGPVDVFLSWNAWLPLARLNYCAYLLHPVVIFHFLLTKKAMFHYTVYEHIFFFWGSLVTTYLFSLFVTLLVEVPTIALEKVLLPRK